MPTDQDFSGFQNDRQKRERQDVRTGGLAPGAMGQGAVAGVASGPFGAQAANPYAGLTQEPLNPTGSALANSSSGPTASGHVNFDQIYNANAGTSARKASQLQGMAGAKGMAARTGMQAASNQFGQMARAGTVQGPTGAQQAFAASGAGSTQANPNVPNVGQQAANPRGPNTSDPMYQQLQAGAAGQYSGPDSLSDMGVYEKLLKDAGEAQDLSTSLASGNEGIQAQGLNQLDAALVGGAGRRGFAELGKQYGNLKGDLDKANQDSIGVADAAKQKSADAAAAYRALLEDAKKPEIVKPNEAPTETSAVKDYEGKDNPDVLSYLFDDPSKGEIDNTWEKGKALAHVTAINASPADQLMMGLGEAGNDVPLVTEAFVNMFDSKAHTAWKWGNILTAVNRVSGFGGKAQKKFITALKRDKNMMQAFMAMKNPGYMARQIRIWFEKQGIKAEKDNTVDQSGHGQQVREMGGGNVTGPKQDSSVTATQGGSSPAAPQAPQAPPGQEWTGQYDGKGRPIFKKKGT